MAVWRAALRSSYSAAVMSDAATRLDTVRAEIARAAKLARRDPAEVTLVAVSKRRSAEEIEALIAAGQRDFGESRVQEAQDKWPALRARHPDVRLHMIGQLQSNKAAEAAALFDVIHSLDRPSLLDALAADAEPRPAYRPGQHRRGGAEGRSRARPSSRAFLDAVRASPVPLAGLMAIPPLGLEPGPFFAFLGELARRHDVTGLSMGMSSDYRHRRHARRHRRPRRNGVVRGLRPRAVAQPRLGMAIDRLPDKSMRLTISSRLSIYWISRRARPRLAVP